MLSEERLIESLRAVARDIGDDAAVLGDGLVLAGDMLVEGVHFDRSKLSLFEIGRRAAGANLSDMAAMGAEPICLLAAFGLPPGVRDVAELARGVGDYGVDLVGGDLSRSTELVVSIAALGRTARPVLRSGGRPGDVLAVTGSLGRQVVSGYTAPVIPRVAEGRALAEVATAMIDISDGIATDAARLAGSSGCEAIVELARLPLAAGATAEQAASGGEDFELLVALPAGIQPAVELTVVGRLEEGAGLRLVDRSGAHVALRGWDHFA